MSKQVRFGNRAVGEDAPVFVTFEAGPTHDGVESAKRLIDAAAQAGADAIKFQILDPDRLVADRKMPFSYDVLVDRETGRTETVTEPLYDILCRRALAPDQWRAVKAHSDGRGLAFFATVGFEDEVTLLEELGCHSIKIASADVNHFPLIRRAARTGMCLQLDTGRSTLGEIEMAVDVIRREGNEDIIIHQCPSGYPARAESVNLNVIPTLKRMFPYPVAFSDHYPGWEMDVAAVAIGADLVEKTITFDRTTRSVEHVMSIEPPEMRRFVETLHAVQTALGTPRREMQDEEHSARYAQRRSTYLPNGARAGQKLGEVPVDFRRPGHGVGPDLYERLAGMTFREDLPPGHQLALGDLA